jgi:ElaB/YqjD/DUF883 family membrane-anchored ribosome-binding protein
MMIDWHKYCIVLLGMQEPVSLRRKDGHIIHFFNTVNNQEEKRMKTLKKILVLLCGLAFLTSFSACKEQGPAESAGEKIDEAVEKTQEKMEDAGDTIREKTEEVGERIEEAGEEMQKTNK